MVALPAAGAKDPPDMLRVAINSDMRSTQFGVNRDGNTDTILHHVVEGLVAYREDLTVGPLLAQRWQVSKDGRTYSFQLRDALFHNGEPVTAADVKWAWERLLKPETRFLCRGWFDGTGDTGIKIERIEAPDPKTVTFTLNEPNPLFLTRMAHMVCLAGIVHRDSLDAKGNWKAPIGTGPYKLKEWRRSQYVDLERFDGYRPAPGARDGYAGNRSAPTARLRFLVIGDGSAAKAALLAGDIDVLLGVDLDAVDELSRHPGVKVLKNVTPGWQVLLLQNRDPAFKDKRRRQAVAQAIERSQVTISATHSLGNPNPSAVGEMLPFFGKEFKEALPHSPHAAKKLLQESGYRGETIKVQANTQHPFDIKSAIMVHGMLRQAGINAELEVLDWATQFKNYSEGRYQMMVMGFSARPDPTMMMDVFVGDKDKRRNAVFDDPRAIELLKASGAEPRPEARRRHFVEIHKRMIDDSSVVGLFNYVEADAVRDRVKGYAPWALGKPRLWGVKLGK
jgi:peptide/nickel transport system substrate-binding protein